MFSRSSLFQAEVRGENGRREEGPSQRVSLSLSTPHAGDEASMKPSFVCLLITTQAATTTTSVIFSFALIIR